MKEPDHESRHELGEDARVARIFRWSSIAAVVLTLIVTAGLIVWWWLSRDTPVTVDEIAMLAPQPLAHNGAEGPRALRFTDITVQIASELTQVNSLYAGSISTRAAACPILRGSNRPRLSRPDAAS